jgi:hypothetical protein
LDPEGHALAEIVLTSGEHFEAVVLEEDASSVTFRTSAGQVRKIDRQLISPSGTRDPEAQHEEPGLEDPGANRLLLFETARPLGRGNGRGRPLPGRSSGTVSYGLTDRLPRRRLTAIPESVSQIACMPLGRVTLAPRKALAVGLFPRQGWARRRGRAYAVSPFGPPSRSRASAWRWRRREIVPVFALTGCMPVPPGAICV